MIEQTDVAVVGAGGGGAVLALALAKQGISTVVLDQAAGPPQGLRGEILQPNGQHVLDRVFQTLDRNERLRYQVLSTTAGLRTAAPFDLIDRVIAAGFLPDCRAHERAPHPMSS